MHYKHRSFNTYKSQPAFSKPRQKGFKATHFKWLIIVALITGLTVHIEIARRASAEALATAEATHVRVANTEFASKVKAIISNNPQTEFSISIINPYLTTPLCFGSCEPQDAASTTKLITAAAYLHKVENGQAALNYKINDQPASEELRLLVNQSDDTAWQAFNDKLGHSYLQDYARHLGLSSYSAENNTISSFDMAKLLKLLRAGQLLNYQHTKTLLSYMQHTNYEDFMSPAIMSGFKLYHKVGIDGDQVNDVGVITGQSKSLELSIFTNGHGSYDWASRADAMQQITKVAQKAYL